MNGGGGQYFPLGTDVADAIFQHVYNRNDDIALVHDSMFAAIFTGGIGVRTRAGTTGLRVKRLSSGAEDSYISFMKDALRWIDMFGMVPLKRSRKSRVVEVIVPDYFSGLFVARFDEDKRLDVGWRTVDTRALNRYDPDEDVFVFIHEQPVNQPNPFMSIFSALLDRMDLAIEMRANYLRANHDATAPPVALVMTPQRVSVLDTGSEADHFRNAGEAAARNRTLRAQQEARYSVERMEDDAEQMEEVEKASVWTSPRVICDESGARRHVDRHAGYLKRHMLLPVGRQPANVQLPAYNSNWMAEEMFSTDRVYALMRWPNPHNSRNARQKMGTSGIKYSEADRDLETNTVKQKREQLKRVFRFVYRCILREIETEGLRGQYIAADSKIDESLAAVPAAPAALRGYVQWMEEHGLQFEHPAIRARREFEKDQARIAFDTEIEQIASALVANAASVGEVLDMATVERHLRIMVLERQKTMTLAAQIEDTRDRTELIFLQESLEGMDVTLNLVQNGLLSPSDAARSLLMDSGTEASRAAQMAQSATGISPLEQEKLRLEKQKLALEKQKIQLQQQKLRDDQKDKKEKNVIAREAVKVKSAAADSGPPKKKIKGK